MEELKPWEVAAQKIQEEPELKPWEQAASKKKDGTEGVKSTSKPLEIGGLTDQRSLLSGQNNKPEAPTMLIGEAKQEAIANQKQYESDLKEYNKTLSQRTVKGIANYLKNNKPKTYDETVYEDPSIVVAREKEKRLASEAVTEKINKEQTDKYKEKYGEGFWSNVKSGADFLGSKLLTGAATGFEGMMATGDMMRRSLGGDRMTDTEKSLYNKGLSKIEEAASLNTNPEFQGYTPMQRVIGGLAEFVPAMVAAESTAGGSFFLNGVGTADKEIRNAEANGVEFKNGADDLYRLGKGITDYFLMSRINAHTIYSKLPNTLRNTIAGKSTIEAIGEVLKSGEKLTAENVTQALKDKAVSFGNKLSQYGTDALKSYRNTSLDLTALAVADNAVKEASNTLAGEENLQKQDIGTAIARILTEDAPGFAALGAVRSSGMLFDKSPMKNEVVKSIKENNSPENIDQIKSDIVEHGAEQGWTEQDIQSSIAHVDNLSQAVKSVPKTFGEKKLDDAVDLIVGKKDLEQQLKTIKEEKGTLDPALQEIPTKEETLVQDKLEQANDKLKELATDKKYKYSFDEEKGVYTKQLGQDGKPEEISKERYDLESVEKEFKDKGEEEAKEETKLPDINNTDETKEVAVDDVVPEQIQEPLKTEDNAIQEQETASLPVQPETKVGEGMEPGIPEPRLEEPAGETAPEKVQGNEQEKVKPEGVSIKNEDVFERRNKYGLPELPDRKGITPEEADNIATDAINKGYNARDLVDAVLDEGRNTTAVENTILNKHQAFLDAEYNRLKAEIENYQGGKSGLDKLLADKDRADQEWDRVTQASVRAGTINSDALRSRQWFKENDYSLSGLFEKMYKADPDRKPLTSSEREFTREKFNEMQAKLAEYESAKDKNIDTLAEKAWKKLQREIAAEQRKTGRAERKEAIDKSIDETIASLLKKVNKQRSTLSANPVPVEAFGDVAKLVKLYAKKGSINLEQAIDAVVTSLKDKFDGLDSKHVKEILAIIGSDNTDVRLEGYKTRTRTNITNLRDRISKGDYQKKVLEGLELDKEARDLRDEYERMKFEFDKEVAKKAYENSSSYEKSLKFVNEVTGLFRVAKTIMDLSAVLNQGGKALLAGNYRSVGSAVKSMFKAMWSDGKFESLVNDLKYAEDYPILKDSGLAITEKKSADLMAREEMTQGTLLEKLPIIGNAKILDKIKLTKDGKIKIGDYNIPLGADLVGISERAYPAFLTSLRVNMFRASDPILRKEYSGEDLQKARLARARDINNISGRADIGKSEKTKALASVLFFAPRYAVSQVRTLTNWANPIWWKSTPPEVRKMYAKEMAAYVGTVAGTLTAASLMGMNIVTNPYDPDFLKLKDGDTRLDISMGTSSYIRQAMMLSMMAAGIKSERSKNDLETVNDRAKAMAQSLVHFGRGKLAPLPAIGTNITLGKDYLGRDYGVTDIPKEFVPLIMNDLKPTFDEHPNLKGVLYDMLAIGGLRVSTYSNKNEKKKHTIKTL